MTKAFDQPKLFELPLEQERRITQLDGLRAIAVFGVLIAHFPPTKHLEWFTTALPWGHLGVRLFFVLSGFLITGILLDRRSVVLLGEQTNRAALKSFYIRRCLRIFPIFYLTILIAYCLDVGHIREMAKWHIFYLSNFEPAVFEDFHNKVFTLRDPTTGHFWSLAVEEQFYLVWPAMILFTTLNQQLRIACGMIIGAVIWRATWFLFFPTLSSMSLLACVDSLGAGAFLAISMRAGIDLLRARAITIAVWVSVAVLVLCCVALRVGTLWRPSMVLLDLSSSIVFAYLIIFLISKRDGKLSKALSWGPVNYLGKISYGIYIYHAFMTPLLFWLLHSLDLSVPAGSILIPVTTTIMTIGISAASWHLIELPIQKLKRFVPRGPNAHSIGAPID